MPRGSLPIEQILALLAQNPQRLTALTAGLPPAQLHTAPGSGEWSLNSLPPKAWSRSATVTGAGQPLERTVRFYAQWLAEHERSHVKHVDRLLRDRL